MSTTGNGQGGNGNGNQPITEAVSADSEVGSAVSGKIAPPPGQQKKADFVSDQEVRWCPGCGDYAIRHNLDLNYILFNNRIYGLTKGQYSPTSEFGKKTKSTPVGTIDYPINPLSLAIASESTFVARSIDIDVKHLGGVVQAAAKHKGISFVEVYQNCNIFNDHAFDSFAERSVRNDRVLYLEHGKPMIFGKDRDRGIRMNGAHPEAVTIGENGITENDLLVHDIYLKDPSVAFMLARMEQPDFPQPVGIFRAVERATYEDMMMGQIDDAIAKSGRGSLEKLINSGDTWVVE